METGLRGRMSTNTEEQAQRKVPEQFPIFKFETRRLEFVHITETGGKSIEMAAAVHAGLKWGKCHYYDCRKNWKRELEPDFDWEGIDRKSWWHHLPQKFPLSNGYNPYDGANLFAVVRNPYDRILSEYYHTEAGYLGPNKNDPNTMNTVVRSKIGSRWISHYIPQHEYIYIDGIRNVDYVLRYESLDVEFNQLMKKYNIPVSLSMMKSCSDDATLMTNDFDDTTIAMINDYYKKDFELFNYKMIKSSSLHGVERNFIKQFFRNNLSTSPNENSDNSEFGHRFLKERPCKILYK